MDWVGSFVFLSLWSSCSLSMLHGFGDLHKSGLLPNEGCRRLPGTPLGHPRPGRLGTLDPRVVYLVVSLDALVKKVSCFALGTYPRFLAIMTSYPSRKRGLAAPLSIVQVDRDSHNALIEVEHQLQQLMFYETVPEVDQPSANCPKRARVHPG